VSTSVASDHGSLFGTIARWWRNWLGDRSRKLELRNLGSEDLNRVAHDAGVSPQVLQALAGKWPEATDLLSRRMAALKLDVEEIERTYPPVSNDLKHLCWLCTSKGRCERDLAKDPSNPVWREYCPNATTLTALSANAARNK